MKSINFRVMTALLALVASGAAQSSEWVSVLKMPDKELALDVSSVTVVGDKVRAWTRNIYPTPRSLVTDPADQSIKIAKVMRFSEYDCAAKESRSLQTTFYDPQDHVLHTVPAEPTAQLVIPDSVDDRFLQRVCAEKASR